MVNVDFASPSLILGTALIGCGVLLLNLRNFQNKVSRDADIVVAAMVSIVGSTLIFQGWRLDPLLLLCQALTTSVALWYGIETFRLRSKEADLMPPQLPPGLGPDPSVLDPAQQAAQQQYYQQQQQGFPSPPGGAPFLPPGRESFYPWGGAGDMDPASTSGRASPGASQYGGGINPYAEMIQYDYYGNPILPQEPAYGNMQYEQYGMAESPGGQPAAETMFGGPYAASTQGPVPGPGPGPSASGAWGAAAEYDNSGFLAIQGPSFDSSRAPGGPYSATAGSTQATSQQGPYTVPPMPQSEANGSVRPAGDAPYGSEYGFGRGSSAENGAVPSVSPAAVADGGAGAAWETPKPEAGLGPNAAASGRGPAGRLDVYGKIDDWE